MGGVNKKKKKKKKRNKASRGLVAPNEKESYISPVKECSKLR